MCARVRQNSESDPCDLCIKNTNDYIIEINTSRSQSVNIVHHAIHKYRLNQRRNHMWTTVDGTGVSVHIKLRFPHL